MRRRFVDYVFSSSRTGNFVLRTTDGKLQIQRRCDSDRLAVGGHY